MKQGTFVTDEIVAIQESERDKIMSMFEAKIKEFFPTNGGKWAGIELETTGSVPHLYLEWKFDKPRSARRFGNGDICYPVKTLKFFICKDFGHLEDKPEVNGLYDFSVSATTDAKYHRYRCHHQNDYPFEGKNHYWYNTDLNDPEFASDADKWLESVGYKKSA